MIMKTNNYYMALYTYEGLTAWIKTAEYKNSFNEIKTVVTELIVTKENNKNEIVYKNISSNWICYYNESNGLSIVDIIEDILYYLANNEYTLNQKVNTIDNVLYNNGVALLNIRLFKKDHLNKLADIKRIEENKKIESEINKKKDDIELIVTNINKYTLMRYKKPSQLNNFIHEFYTNNSLKIFDFGTGINEELKGYNNMLKWLNEYLYYISNDFDPIEFMLFDKVA